MWLETMNKRKLYLAIAIVVVGLLVGLVIWTMPPSSSAFKPGLTRQEYRERFGEPSWILTDDDANAVMASKERYELWGYQAMDCDVFVIFSANSPQAVDLVRTTKGIEKLIGSPPKTAR